MEEMEMDTVITEQPQYLETTKYCNLQKKWTL
jgi:hypothetical protein